MKSLPNVEVTWFLRTTESLLVIRKEIPSLSKRAYYMFYKTLAITCMTNRWTDVSSRKSKTIKASWQKSTVFQSLRKSFSPNAKAPVQDSGQAIRTDTARRAQLGWPSEDTTCQEQKMVLYLIWSWIPTPFQAVWQSPSFMSNSLEKRRPYMEESRMRRPGWMRAAPTKLSANILRTSALRKRAIKSYTMARLENK